eukprot:c1491_g1_i1.p1 GENE.c1491_g1_i1~~c1491_g1_i1.p1  ORF type:complete len:120 (-),score=30.87 c1491_g1_i1:163-486(-)
MADANLDEQFRRAVYLIRNGPAIDSDNETKLTFYKYFKQATIGDCTGDRPGMFSFEARAKFDAWDSVKGTSSENAKAEYIKVLQGLNPQWELNEVLQNIPADFKVSA